MPVYGGFFATLGEGCAAPGEITQETLLRLAGVEGLRRQQLPIKFLAERLRLGWAQSDSESFNEARRLDEQLLEQATQTWAADLVAYRAHLALGRAKPKSVRVYIGAAIRLMSLAGVERAAELTQLQIDRLLRRKPGHRASLWPFTSWLQVAHGVRVVMAPKKKTNPRARERAVLAKSRGLLDRLEAAGDHREGRAVLAAAIAQVFQLPLSKVLALTRDEVAADRAGVELWPTSHRLTLPPVLEVGYRRFAAREGRLLFPGRNGVQPLSPGAVSHHLSRRLRGDSELHTRGHRCSTLAPDASVPPRTSL